MFGFGQRRSLLWVSALFGGAFLYCLQGAITGRLYLADKYGAEAVASGIAAWGHVVAAVLLWLGVAIRLGFRSGLPPRLRLVVELSFLAAGIAVFLWSRTACCYRVL